MVSIWGAYARADMIDTGDMAAWEVCAMCHGVDGVSAVTKFPKLAGQKPMYIEQQLRRFRRGLRSNDGGQMQTISTEVNEADIAGIATYFAEQSTTVERRTQGGHQRQQMQLGQKIFEQGKPGVAACKNCHGDPQSQAPWLNAQHQDYLQKQIFDFASGARKSNISPMEKVAKKLTPAEIEAVTKYLNSTSLARTK